MNTISKTIITVIKPVNMNSKPITKQTLYILIMLISFLFSVERLIAQPTITSFAPLIGKVGDTITISGNSFNTTPANNIVFFGATRATVITATAISLIVRVPVGATFAPITVLNTSTALAAYSSQFFNPRFSPNKGSITPADMELNIDYATGSRPYSVAIGDIDGDGKPDLAIANNGNSSNSVSILRNTGISGIISFATKVDFATGSNPNSVATSDIDGDGKLDLVIVNQSNNSVSVLRNTSIIGAISFATKVDFTTGINPFSLAISDLNGDGKPDLAVANFGISGGGFTVSVLQNTGSIGTITFATKVDLTTGIGPSSVVIGDIDGNGKPDLAITNYGNASVSIFRNTGISSSISFATRVDFATNSNPNSLAIGDIDGDTKLDLVIIYNNNITFSILRNTSMSGTINFAAKVDFATGSNLGSVSIGDIDGDGKLDLGITNPANNSVSIFRNTGSGATISFATKVDFPTGSTPQAIAIGDIDGDGKSDMAIANDYNNTISVFRNNPQPPSPKIVSISPSSGAVGSTISIIGSGFNTTPANNVVFFGATKATVSVATDSNLTVIVPLGATYAPVTVLNTVTTFTGYSLTFFNPTFNPNKSNITSADLAPKIDFASGFSTKSIAIGDLNGDGKPDLAIANISNNTVSILCNNGISGTISFATKVDFATGLNPYALAIGDIDGDGKPDLAITNNFFNTVSIFRNTSTGSIISFAAKIDFGTNGSPNSIAIGDIDGNGKPDLVIANNASVGSVSIFRNTGTIGIINFATKVDFSVNANPISVSIGDIDGDGKPDLAMANNVVSNYISILRNTSILSTITFEPNLYLTTGNWAKSSAIGDFDGDNKLDLAVISNSTISVLRNNSTIGSISFANKVDFLTGLGALSVTAGDINGDGKLDVTTANFGTNGNTISLLCNTSISGTVNFSNKVDYTTGTNPISVAIGDMDGDGKSDLTVAYDANAVSVIRNNPQLPTITTTNTLTNFVSCAGKVSAQQNFIVSGVFLSANLLVIPPTGFEVSLISGSGFGDSVSLTPISGIVNNTTIYIRLKNSITGMPGGNVVCTSAGAITKNLAASGLVNTVSITTSTSNISICPTALPFSWNGRIYNATSTDTIYLANTLGCDSVTILKLTVKPISSSTSNISICPSSLPYTWNGRTYTAAKTDTVYFINSLGCDSITILELTVKPSSTSITNLSICPNVLPFTWNSKVYNASATDTVILTNSVGCDSITILNLTVNPKPATSNITGLTNVARLDTASYSVIGTNGSVFNWVTTKGLVQTGVGTNQIQVKWNIAGIDTLKVTETSNQGCVGSQKTLLVNIGPATSMHEINASNNILVYPNPFNETIFISLLNNSGLNKAILFDLLGKEVLTTHKNEIDVKELKSGIYLIMVIDNNGNSYSQKLIKY